MPLKPDLPPGSTNYTITVDVTNFSAERMVMGQKVEAATLRVTANNQGYELKGDVKIDGTPAQLEYRKPQATATPRSGFRRRSTRRRARSSASTAQRLAARCRSGSPVASPRPSRKAASRSRPT